MTHKPMKFHSVETGMIVAFVEDDEWVAQQKVDGVRAQLVIEEDGEIWARASGGERLKSSVAAPVADTVIDGIQNLPTGMYDQLKGTTFDGEIVEGVWWMFDILTPDTRHDAYEYRLMMLQGLLEAWNLHPLIKLLPTAIGAEAKGVLAMEILATGGEGIMFKHLRSRYVPGKRVRDSVKAKFVKTADVIIIDTAVGTSTKVGDAKATDKLNASFGVHDEDGKLVEIGRCSLLGKPAVKAGDVIEVKYLYLGAGSRLVQPTLHRVRDDKPAEDCRFDQFVMVSKRVVTL